MTDKAPPSPTAITDAVDDAPPVFERLDGGGPPPSPNEVRILFRVATIAILVALLVVGAAQFWPRQAITPTRATLSTPTPAPAVPRGWSRRGPSDAASIAFGQSPSTVGYGCGPDSVPPGSAPPHTVNLYSSVDGGNSWRALSFQIAGLPNDGGVHGFFGVSCALSVDPLDSRDVALLVGYQACGQGFANALYRTRDGGATWAQMTLPAWDSSGEQAQASGEIAWAGSTLYVAAGAPCGTPVNRVATSANGSSFQWANYAALFTGAPSLGPFTPVGDYLYVRLDSRANCPPTCSLYKRTSDGGQTWETFMPEWQGHELGLLDDYWAHQGAHALYAQYVPDGQDICSVQRAYYRSSDDGATWTMLPGLSVGLYIEQVVDSPDGTTYAEVTSMCSGTVSKWGIYRLRSAETSWVRVAVYPQTPISLSWDVNGHPTGLWATPLSQTQAYYLIYHTP